MRKFLAASALAFLASSSLVGNAAGTPQTVTLRVSNMTCELCPVTVKKSLQGVHGVVSAKADLTTKTATVSYDPSATNIDALIQATTNAGYPSTVNK